MKVSKFTRQQVTTRENLRLRLKRAYACATRHYLETHHTVLLPRAFTPHEPLVQTFTMELDAKRHISFMASLGQTPPSTWEHRKNTRRSNAAYGHPCRVQNQRAFHFLVG